MATNMIINPASVSFASIRNDLETWLRSLPDYLSWKDHFESSTGRTIYELMAGFSTYLAFKEISARRENYLLYAENESSVIAGGQMLGYSSFRGSNPHLFLVVIPNSTITLPKFSTIGTVKDVDLVIASSVSFVSGYPVMIECIAGNVASSELIANSPDLQVFRFTETTCTQDICVYVDDKEVYLSNVNIDLIKDYFVALTNVYGNVDIKSFNRYRNQVSWVGNTRKEIGEFCIPSTGSTGLIYKCEIAGTTNSLGIEPNWSSVIEGGSLSDGTVTWLAVKDLSYNAGSVIRLDFIENKVLDITNISDIVFDYGSLITNTLDVSGVVTRTDNTSYEAGDIVKASSSGVSTYFECFSPGTSAGSEPTWNTEINQLTTDGGVEWISRYTRILQANINKESKEDIKVNAPFYHETQNLIRAREDYIKAFASLNSNFTSVNYQNIAVALVELSYVLSDDSLLTSGEKDEYISELYGRAALGIPAPLITDPVRYNLMLKFKVFLKSTNQYDILTQAQGVINNYMRKLEAKIDLYEIEGLIADVKNNDTEYVKACRYEDTRKDSEVYYLNDMIIYQTGVFVCTTSGTSHNSAPSFNYTVGATTIDGSVVWTCYAILENGSFSLNWKDYVVVDLNTSDLIIM
jgi:hypothetical protein